MNVSTDPQAINEVLSRSIAELYPSKDELKQALQKGQQLTFYVGIDPTADYVHLGHSTNFLLLERLHRMGHRIIVLVGDFTAMIGDPSDKTSMRIQLTREQVEANLKTFKDQIGKILDFNAQDNPIEFKFNSSWLSSLTFKDSVELASNFTIQQMLERDAFQKRLGEQKPLYVHEFFYPLMQGYDSVAMDVDAEIGGTDQTFNMLAGRTLLKRYKNKEKFVLTTTLLENPETGEKLMSKSLGTGIALNEPAKDMYFKTMKLPDAAIIQCFIDCTRLSLEQIEVYQQQLKDGANPRDIKLALAHEITAMYHDPAAADTAQQAWIAEVSEKKVPDNLAELLLDGQTDLLDKLVELGVVASKSQARRLLEEGAVKVDGTRVSLDNYQSEARNGQLLTVGKKYTYQLRQS